MSTKTSSSDSSEKPFRISVLDSELVLLRAKLASTRLPTSDLEDAGWSYGAPITDVRRLFLHWKDTFDWRSHEAKLNEELPQFTRDIEVDGHGSLNIQYVHKQSVIGGTAIPLLFVHGWPGNFLDVRKILPLLTDSAAEGDPSFHVVAIVLPGYGFSESPRKKEFGLAQYAEVSHKLMLALGYNEYVTQGGDLGFFITRAIASIYGGTHSKAWHTHSPLGAKPEPSADDIPFTATELAGLAQSALFEDGYLKTQTNKPQTLAYGITDSPVALLGWIYEKLVLWSDKYPWTDDEVIELISTYWFSRAGPGATFNTYYELFNPRNGAPVLEKPTIPLGLSHFPKDVVVMPNAWTRSIGNVVFDGEHTSGGHFAAHEKSAELVGDVKNMFGKGGPAFGVVPGKNGYRASSS